MENKFKRFGDALGKTLKNIGTSAEKVLDSPALKKLDEDLKKATGDF